MNETFDTHAHLDELPDLEGALLRAREKGVCGIVAMSMGLDSSRRTLAIKEKFTQIPIYVALGIHPQNANLSDLSSTIDLIKQNRSRIVAVGEIGLDFWYKWVKKDDAKKDEQRQVFRAFLEIAREFDLPAIIHARGAWQECLDIVLDVKLKKANFHWYSGPLDVLEKILQAGFFVSTSPSLTHSKELRQAMMATPIEQTLIETDCPVVFREDDGVNTFQAEPKDVFRTLKAYCDLKNIASDKAITIFNQNTKKFFNF